jgi:ankyrin repeat protein
MTVVRMLVEAGADVNAATVNGQTPLYEAAAEGFYEVLVYLHQQGAAVNTTLETGDNVLFEITRKMEGRPLNFAVTVEQGSQKVTLREADEIRAVIGRHPDDEHRAYLQIVDHLVRHGIDLNARLVETDQTPLFMPAESGQADVLALMLLGRGVNVNHRDKWGLTALHYASRGGHPQVVDLLIAAGALVNTPDRYGFTPLHEAAERGRQAVVELLQARGADVALGLTADYPPFAVGDTPADVARKAGKNYP